jgi:broad specificity phosphatase PhoE
MNPFTLTLLRHGEIDHGGRLIGGRSDLPLTEHGQIQLAASWDKLTVSPVTAMATSPLARCRAFAVEQALRCAVTLKVDERFAECDFGLWDGELLAALQANKPDWQQQLEAGTLTPPDGESFDVFRTRVLAGFTKWIEESRGSHRVLVSHGGVIAVLLAELLGAEFSVARLINVPRGGFAQLSILEGHPAYLTRLEGPPGEDPQ